MKKVALLLLSLVLLLAMVGCQGATKDGQVADGGDAIVTDGGEATTTTTRAPDSYKYDVYAMANIKEIGRNAHYNREYNYYGSNGYALCPYCGDGLLMTAVIRKADFGKATVIVADDEYCSKCNEYVNWTVQFVLVE